MLIYGTPDILNGPAGALEGVGGLGAADTFNLSELPVIIEQSFGVVGTARRIAHPVFGPNYIYALVAVDATSNQPGVIFDAQTNQAAMIAPGSAPIATATLDRRADRPGDVFMVGFAGYPDPAPQRAGQPLSFAVPAGTMPRVVFDDLVLSGVSEVLRLLLSSPFSLEDQARAGLRLAQIASRKGLSENETAALVGSDPANLRAIGVDMRTFYPDIPRSQPEILIPALNVELSEGLRYALSTGMTRAQYYDNIRTAIQNAGFDIPAIAAEMGVYTVSLDDVTRALGARLGVPAATLPRSSWLRLLEAYLQSPSAYYALLDEEAFAAIAAAKRLQEEAAAAADAAAAAAAAAAATAAAALTVTTQAAADSAAQAATVAQAAAASAQTAVTVEQVADAAAAAAEAATVAQSAAQSAVVEAQSAAQTAEDAAAIAEVAQTAADSATTTTTATTTATTGAPAMLQLPANLSTMNEAQKVAWYRATLAAGNSDAAIRAAVESVYGRQSDTDWTYLRAKAAQAGAGAAGGGAGLLIAAAAAYFLLG